MPANVKEELLEAMDTAASQQRVIDSMANGFYAAAVPTYPRSDDSLEFSTQATVAEADAGRYRGQGLVFMSSSIHIIPFTNPARLESRDILQLTYGDG